MKPEEEYKDLIKKLFSTLERIAGFMSGITEIRRGIENVLTEVDAAFKLIALARTDITRLTNDVDTLEKVTKILKNIRRHFIVLYGIAIMNLALLILLVALIISLA